HKHTNMFSASCHYGLQAMFYIAMHSTDGNNVELSEIATEQDIPKHFLSKILQQLVKQKLLVSMKGPTGGFKLSRPPKKIAIIDVVEAIDGLDIFRQCGSSTKECDENDPCPIHEDYKKIRERVYHLFLTTSLEGLVGDMKNENGIAGVGKKPDQRP
ncbi:MAG: Rrf2 family transcriptional regulator, partial [Balneolaceae bacterium]|nr:Rrf2 family transcriptional regulator [Balneolaceae bacterium]